MATLDYCDIPAFCINLDSRPERWEAARGEFDKLGWSVARFSAVQHTAAPYPKLSPQQAGCLDSHRQLWRHCLDNELPALAVFEDDVVLSGDFKDIFAAAFAELPYDWDVWHLHSAHARCFTKLEKYVGRVCGEMWGTQGYLIRPAGCERLLELGTAAPVDYLMSTHLCNCGGHVYGMPAEHTLAFQRGDDSDIPRTAQLAFWRKLRTQHCR